MHPNVLMEYCFSMVGKALMGRVKLTLIRKLQPSVFYKCLIRMFRLPTTH